MLAKYLWHKLKKRKMLISSNLLATLLGMWVGWGPLTLTHTPRLTLTHTHTHSRCCSNDVIPPFGRLAPHQDVA